MVRHFILMTFFSSCKSDKAVTASKAVTNAVATVPMKAKLPILPKDLVMRVWNEVDLLDYIFHNLPFSMNQNEQASIRTNLTYFSEEPVDRPVGCKPISRQFYQVSGDIFMEADVYFDDNCKFYVFIIDGKEKYANKMSPEGITFFTNMISQALKASKGGPQ